jgi:hypothetical protein
VKHERVPVDLALAAAFRQRDVPLPLRPVPVEDGLATEKDQELDTGIAAPRETSTIFSRASGSVNGTWEPLRLRQLEGAGRPRVLAPPVARTRLAQR